MTTTALRTRRITLAARERQVLEGMAEGLDVDEVGAKLGISGGTVAGYLKSAKVKLGGVREVPAAVAVAYTTAAITAPALRGAGEVYVPVEQRDLIPLVAQGMSQIQMASELSRDVRHVRRDGRELLASLGARNRAHLVARAWEHQLLSADDVAAWMKPSARPVPAAP